MAVLVTVPYAAILSSGVCLAPVCLVTSGRVCDYGWSSTSLMVHAQVWTSRQPGLQQALPLDDYAADHNTFEAGPGHKDDSAHEDSGTVSAMSRKIPDAQMLLKQLFEHTDLCMYQFCVW